MTEKTHDHGAMNALIRRAAHKGKWTTTTDTPPEHRTMNDLIRRAAGHDVDAKENTHAEHD